MSGTENSDQKIKPIGAAEVPDIPKPDLGKKCDYYLGWLKHEEIIFTNRANYFLVAEAMLFTAYAALPQWKSGYIFCMLGVGITLVWLWVSFLQNELTRKALKEKLKLCEMWNSIASTQPCSALLKSYFWIGVVIPLMLLAAWVTLLLDMVCICINCK